MILISFFFFPLIDNLIKFCYKQRMSHQLKNLGLLLTINEYCVFHIEGFFAQQLFLYFIWYSCHFYTNWAELFGLVWNWRVFNVDYDMCKKYSHRLILNNFQKIFLKFSKSWGFCGVLGSNSIITTSNKSYLLESFSKLCRFLKANIVWPLLLKKKCCCYLTSFFFHETRSFLAEID